MRQMAAKKSDPVPENSQEFLERKRLIELQEESDVRKHQRNMEEAEYRRESDLLHHERELERQRIKTAEIKKLQQDKNKFKEYYGNR